MDWNALQARRVPPPIKPALKSATDTSCFEDIKADTRITPYTDTGDAWDAEF